jgi:hypothetical protein
LACCVHSDCRTALGHISDAGVAVAVKELTETVKDLARRAHGGGVPPAIDKQKAHCVETKSQLNDTRQEEPDSHSRPGLETTPQLETWETVTATGDKSNIVIQCAWNVGWTTGIPDSWQSGESASQTAAADPQHQDHSQPAESLPRQLDLKPSSPAVPTHSENEVDRRSQGAGMAKRVLFGAVIASCILVIVGEVL